MPPITLATEIDISDITTGSMDGTGAFDVLMRTVGLHLTNEYSHGRITGDRYAQSYTEALIATLDQATRFVVSSAQVGQQEGLHQAQIDKIYKEIEVMGVQMDQIVASTAQTVAQTELINAQTDNAIAQLPLTQAQTAHTTAQTAQVAVQSELIEAQTQQTLKQVEVATAQVSNIESDTQVNTARVTQMGIQNTMTTAQTGQVTKQTELTTAQIAQMALQDDLIIAQTAQTTKQTELGTAQITKVNADTSLVGTQELLVTYQGNTEQAKYLDVVAGATVTGVVGKQKEVYAAQAKGFKDSALQAAAKTVIDTWSVRRTTDEATKASPQSGLQDTNVGSAVEEMFRNLQIPYDEIPDGTSPA